MSISMGDNVHTFANFFSQKVVPYKHFGTPSCIVCLWTYTLIFEEDMCPHWSQCLQSCWTVWVVTMWVVNVLVVTMKLVTVASGHCASDHFKVVTVVVVTVWVITVCPQILQQTSKLLWLTGAISSGTDVSSCWTSASSRWPGASYCWTGAGARGCLNILCGYLASYSCWLGGYI